MIELDEAWQRLDDVVTVLAPDVAAPWDANGRFVAEAVTGHTDLPPFDNSAMDGYALRAEDVRDATDELPVRLRIIGDTFAGDAPGPMVTPGSAARIMTGAPMPDGADCVLRLEDARLRDDVVEVRSSVPAGRHVRRRGEDVATGSQLAERGATVTPGLVGLLASSGIDAVRVGARPRVGILVTGSELVPPGSPLRSGAIHDANGPLLESLASTTGARLTSHGIVGDDRALLQHRIATAAYASDVLVISGGVSVGRRDYVKRVLEELGAERLFWRVRMKPGKPLLAARMPSGCIVLGLPGNPVSALAGWTLFVAPVLDRLAGRTSRLGPRRRTARLTQPVRGDANRTLMMTAGTTLDENGILRVAPTRSQGSAMLRSMADADCFLRVEAGSELAADALVTTYPFVAA